MRLLAKYLRAIPTDVRAYFRPFLYGLFGGLAAVGFQAGIKVLEWVLWTQLSHIATGYFVLASDHKYLRIRDLYKELGI